ncbi:hypothetical protein ACOACO_17465 [Nocardioides sp. CPCC 205120]|uniref:hypothetical protein n=1 Tax=Nocardioides sp. CPCC 205120 TaxID=3406462 RepID=UPI003B514C6F
MTLAATTLTYVRTVDGGTVALEEGAAVPVEADEAHVRQLAERGALAEQTPIVRPPAPQPPTTRATGKGKTTDGATGA